MAPTLANGSLVHSLTRRPAAYTRIDEYLKLLMPDLLTCTSRG